MIFKQKGYLAGIGNVIVTMLWTLAVVFVALGLAIGYVIWG